MKRLPTMKDLDDVGHDAGALMDATRWELERAIASARSEADRASFVDDLKRLDKLHERYFGAQP